MPYDLQSPQLGICIIFLHIRKLKDQKMTLLMSFSVK